ncbi:unnamed protein product [Lactuca saligna]|uniref:Uncharacterized protein n=1 Tax=Lactuca saligna TaxID=75948 RepID=A0AA36E8T6_LACSI|nr:unnamed protein product [Lactuca saligna]
MSCFIRRKAIVLGNYECFLDVRLTRDNNITTRKIYQLQFVLYQEAYSGNSIKSTVATTFFKRYLARRAVEALKGVLKLQALVRGHNVRRRTKMIVKCKQALVCVQARVCDQRRKLSDEGSFDSNIFWGSHLADNNSITREESSINTDEWDRRHACRIEI